MRIAVVGGMNLDLLGFPDGVLLPRDSNPGRVAFRPGGVGRNIAARLAAMGQQTFLITALGNDERAELLRGFCAGVGIDLSLSLQTPCPSPCYLCIHDEKGDMSVAISDMTAMDRLTPEAMASRMEAVNGADACVLDANLPADTLLYIARHAKIPLLLDPVSCVKAQRARTILPHLWAIKPNQLEAAALTGENLPQRAADVLIQAGVKYVFISLGAEGVYYAGDGERGIVPALPLPALPLTGAGDALCAGLTLALLRGESPRSCALMGCQAAHEALLAAL